MSEADGHHLIAKMMERAGLSPEFEGSSNPEIDSALRGASKRGSGSKGRPDLVAVSVGVPIVVEIKSSRSHQYQKSEDGELSLTNKAISDYADNRAVHYAHQILSNSRFEEVVAVGCVVEGAHVIIHPYVCHNWLGKNEHVKVAPITDFEPLSERNIGHLIVSEIYGMGLDMLYDTDECGRATCGIRKRIDGALDSRTARNNAMGLYLLANMDPNLHELKGNCTSSEEMIGMFNGILDELGVSFPSKDDSDAYRNAMKRASRRFRSKELRGIASEVPKSYNGIDFVNASAFYSGFTEVESHIHDGLEKVDTGLYCQAIVSILDPMPDNSVLIPYSGDGMFPVCYFRRLYAKRVMSSEIKRSLSNIHCIEPDPDRYATTVTNLILMGAKELSTINGRFPEDLGPWKDRRFDYVISDLTEHGLKDAQMIDALASMLSLAKPGGKVAAIVSMNTISSGEKRLSVMREDILRRNRIELIQRIDPKRCIVTFIAGRPNERNMTSVGALQGTVREIYRLVSICRDNHRTKRYNVDPERWWVNGDIGRGPTSLERLRELTMGYVRFRADMILKGYDRSLWGNTGTRAGAVPDEETKEGRFKMGVYLCLDPEPEVSVRKGTMVPRVTTRGSDNGWSERAEPDGRCYRRGCITFNMDAGIPTDMMYQPCPFVLGRGARPYILSPVERIGPGAAAYLAFAIADQFGDYSRICLDVPRDILDLKLRLPSNDGKPDWGLMETTVGKLERECMEALGIDPGTLTYRNATIAPVSKGPVPEPKGVVKKASGKGTVPALTYGSAPVFALTYYNEEVARGIPLGDGGFRVLKGSRLIPRRSVANYTARITRSELRGDGTVVKNVFQTDRDFDSMRQATSAILGTDTPGLDR